MECLTNVCEDGGVIHSNLCCNENKPPQRIMASEEHVIWPNCMPVFPLVPPDTQPAVSAPLCLWEHGVSDVPLGFLLNYGSVWLCLSCSIPSRDVIPQPIFTSLLPSGRDDDSHSDQWRTPVRPNNKDTWMHTKILNMWIHNVIRRHVWTTPQQLCAGFLSIISSLTYVHLCVIILCRFTIT